jgi:hypothetical protein
LLEPLERLTRDGLVLELQLPGVLFDAVALGQAWRDRIDADAVAAQLTNRNSDLSVAQRLLCDPTFLSSLR